MYTWFFFDARFLALYDLTQCSVVVNGTSITVTPTNTTDTQSGDIRVVTANGCVFVHAPTGTVVSVTSPNGVTILGPAVEISLGTVAATVDTKIAMAAGLRRGFDAAARLMELKHAGVPLL